MEAFNAGNIGAGVAFIHSLILQSFVLSHCQGPDAMLASLVDTEDKANPGSVLWH